MISAADRNDVDLQLDSSSVQNLRATLVAALSGASITLATSAAIVGGVLTASEHAVAEATPAAQAAAASAVPTLPVPAVRVAAPSSAPAKKTPSSTPRKKPSVDTSRCTNRINYASDPRDNATINSIGEQTGKCPRPLTSRTGSADGRTEARRTDSCLDRGTCGRPAGSASGGDRSDEAYGGTDPNYRDVNGDTYYSACSRMGYEPGPTCPAS